MEDGFSFLHISVLETQKMTQDAISVKRFGTCGLYNDAANICAKFLFFKKLLVWLICRCAQ